MRVTRGVTMFAKSRSLGLTEQLDAEEAETGVLVVYDAVALAGSGFESVTVENGDRTARALDQTSFFQRANGQRNGGSRRAKHVGHELMGECKPVGGHAIAARQKPACEAFFNCVQAIAGGGLANLDEVCVNVVQQATADLCRSVELGDERGGGNTESLSGNLDSDIDRGTGCSKQDGEPDNTIATDD